MKSGDLSEIERLDSSPNGGGDSSSQVPEPKRRVSLSLVLLGGVAIGLLVGVTVTSLWRIRRNHEEDMPPLQRAERLIQNCEKQIEEMQKALESLRSA